MQQSQEQQLDSSRSALPRASLEAVLDFAWDAGVFTSGDVVQATQLTRSTAIEGIDDLIGRGLLRELPNARAVGEYSKGRPARRFELNAEHAVLVGVDAGPGHLTTIAADLHGRPLARVARELAREQESAEARRELIIEVVRDALAEAGRDRSELLAICVGVPAPVDASGNSPVHPDGFWHRANPGISELLGDWAPIVRVENDASLAAVAEGSVGAAAGEKDFVSLLAGARFGAGVVLEGRLLRGAHGGVGEMVAFDHVVGVGKADGLGQRIADWAREGLADLPPGHPLEGVDPGTVTPRTVLELDAAGDAWAAAFAARAGDLLARIAAVLGSLFDPAVLVVSGGVSGTIQGVLEAARSRLPGLMDMPPPELRASALGPDVVVMGAVSGAVQAARERVLHLPVTR